MEVHDTGPHPPGAGPPVVFLHGLLVDGSLWDPVVELLPGRRCVVPTLPLGSHTVPVADRSVLTPVGVADLVADELERLDLHDVTLVANDTGGAIAQLLLTRRPERVAKLVLTPCDALEVFPPAIFKPLFAFARYPALFAAAMAPTRFPPARRLPIAYGWLAKRASQETLGRWVAPALTSHEIRRDIAHFARHVDPGLLLDAAPKLRGFDGEVVIAWPPEDRCFPVALGRRLAAQFKSARFIEIADSYSFVPIDRPDALAPLI
jgi:pimeloyl-ACP methyl ester carboxylesterase